MKHITRLILLFLLILFANACKKNKLEVMPMGSLNITNAIAGGTTARFGSYATTIANNNFTQYSLLTGNSPLYIFPVGDSLHPYYNDNKFFESATDSYSLFLAGTPAAVDAILIKESISYRTDSTLGIRFINLSQNSPALNITLSTSPWVNEAAGLGYKKYTDLKSYPSLYNSNYTFQIRDPANPNTVLTTFPLTAAALPRFANITLVIKGPSPAVSIFRVNNDR